MRRAKEASGEGRHLDAGADYLRALQRPGLDPETIQKFESALSSEFYSARRQLEAEARERYVLASIANPHPRFPGPTLLPGGMIPPESI